jgi:hypothetical protein
MSFLFNSTFLFVIATLSILISLVLLILVLRLRSHYNSLVKDADKKTLTSALQGIQKTLASHERALVVNKKSISKIEDDGKLHLQKLSLKRFNPFSNTGGDQSFILSFLDGNQDGVIITSLHSRENTRFYVKSVKNGEGVEHPLSREEKKVIK